MELYEFINKNRDKLKSDFDLAALCYDYLLRKTKRIGQANFIGEYLQFSEDSEGNQDNNLNLMMLREFTDHMVDLLSNKCFTMDEKLDEILDFISSTRLCLKPFGRKTYNEATIAYHLLLAIDLHAEHCFVNSQAAPLNETYQTNAYIYRCQKYGIIKNASDELKFREQIQTTEIRNGLSCLRILEKTELRRKANPPKMVTLYIDDEDADRKQITQGQRMNVAMIPFGRNGICSFSKKRGGSFRVEYMESHKENGIEKALGLLETAIQDGANIVVFPEYVCFPEMQEAISAYLKDTNSKRPNKIKQLLLVIAGSGWANDDNNVCKVYSYSGAYLGEYYKCEPFEKEIEVKTADGKKRISHIIEGLRDPGKESVIVQIPNVGSVMTAICRDISNRSIAEKIARVFHVDFLVVPAYSNSIHHAFVNQLKNITETNMNTCSVVCNCCAAIKDENWNKTWERGIVVTPYKQGSLVKGKDFIVCLKDEMRENCNVCNGCIFRLSISFQAEDVRKGEMVQITPVFR